MQQNPFLQTDCNEKRNKENLEETNKKKKGKLL